MSETEDRPDQRDDDREDDTDRAIKLAREHVIEAVRLLASIMYSEPMHDTAPVIVAANETRVKAAISLLEVAGCL